MTRCARQVPASVLVALAILLAGAGTVAATDDYTLPFYDPNVTLSYGVDRNMQPGVQLDWTGQVWAGDAPHWGRVYDNHTGSDYPMPVLSDLAAAKGGTVIDVEGGYGTQQFGNFGNFVQIRHADGRDTLYYHLASAANGGLVVTVGQVVSAGRGSPALAAAASASARTCTSRCSFSRAAT